MIGQPLGCILSLLIGSMSIAVSLGLFWCVNRAHPGLIGGWSAFCLLPVVSVVAFTLMMDFGHRMEIRVFFRKRGLRIQRIRQFPNHYRVDFIQDGSKKSGKWPADFEDWVKPDRE